MRRRTIPWLMGLVAFAVPPAHGQTGQPTAAPPPPPPPSVKVGDKAPDFSLSYLASKPEGGVEPKQVSLSEYRGKKNVVLAFFPAAFSPG